MPGPCEKERPPARGSLSLPPKLGLGEPPRITGGVLGISEGTGSARRAVSSSRGREDEKMRGEEDNGGGFESVRCLDGDVMVN